MQDVEVAALVGSLDLNDLREVVRVASARHEDVARAVRLAAGRAAEDFRQLRAEIDGGLRTRRFLDYRESSGWAMQAAPVVAEIRAAVLASSSATLVALIQRAVGHVVKVIGHADDSDGVIGDLARELLDLHAKACDAGVADPVKLAQWMVRFCCEDQDFFEVDPVRYADALGEPGLAWYRGEIGRRRDRGDSSFAVSYAEERLAVLDGDTDAIVALLGGDLSSPYQFVRVAAAMAELGRDDDVLAWARRGISETSGWQIAQLYDLAAGVYARQSRPGDVLALRREQHDRMASVSTYGGLRSAAEAEGVWPEQREAARSALRERDLGALVDVLLNDGEPGAAWEVTLDDPEWDPGGQRWLRLAEAREPSDPGDALAVYLRLIDAQLETTGRSAYARAIEILKRARRAADAAGQRRAFADYLAALRERHRRRPTLIAMLKKAAPDEDAAVGDPP